MIDSEALRKDIRDHGYRMDFVAEKLNIGYQTLFNKVDNRSEFTVSEIQAYCSLTNRKVPEVLNIFFPEQ